MDKKDLDLIINDLIKKYGGTKNQYLRLMDNISYHESRNNEKQAQKGGGPGRGLFQFEIGKYKGGNTALNRTKRYYTDLGLKIPKWLKSNNGSVDASLLNKEQQQILFLSNIKYHPKANFKNLWDNKETEEDFWAKYHWAGSKDLYKKRITQYNDSLKTYVSPYNEEQQISENKPYKDINLLKVKKDKINVNTKPFLKVDTNMKSKLLNLDSISFNAFGGPINPPSDKLKKETLKKINKDTNLNFSEEGANVLFQDYNTPERKTLNFGAYNHAFSANPSRTGKYDVSVDNYRYINNDNVYNKIRELNPGVDLTFSRGYANGGFIDNEDSLSIIGNGGTHEQNKYGGVPIGGRNRAEEKEAIFNIKGKKYIFSNRLK